MKKILIISPHFPPNNTPDMHRIRIMLPFFSEQGIEVKVLAVNPKYIEAPLDKYISKSVPDEIEVVRANALNQKFTRKFGLGNLGLRAFYFLFKKGNNIIKEFKPDVIFFSTTVFSVIPLGRIWKRKFGIPFIVDMQDPWRNDYYLTLPKNKRPAKYWFAHKLNSVLEKITIPHASGIVSVNQSYIDILKLRYNKNFNAQTLVMPLGAPSNDFNLIKNIEIPLSVILNNEFINIVYTGVVPENMKFSIESVILATKKFNLIHEKKIRLYFVGTNYAPDEMHVKQVEPIAIKHKAEEIVFEYTKRIPYFEAIKLMQNADLLLLPGTFDDNYTASKIFPYILAEKKVLAVFNENSELKDILEGITNLPYVGFNKDSNMDILTEEVSKIIDILIKDFELKTNSEKFKPYTYENMARKFIEFTKKIL